LRGGLRLERGGGRRREEFGRLKIIGTLEKQEVSFIHWIIGYSLSLTNREK
jgi:hypothetical protein